MAWDNAPGSRIMVSLLLPGPMEADQWLHKVRANRHMWPLQMTSLLQICLLSPLRGIVSRDNGQLRGKCAIFTHNFSCPSISLTPGASSLVTPLEYRVVSMSYSPADRSRNLHAQGERRRLQARHIWEKDTTQLAHDQGASLDQACCRPSILRCFTGASFSTSVQKSLVGLKIPTRDQICTGSGDNGNCVKHGLLRKLLHSLRVNGSGLCTSNGCAVHCHLTTMSELLYKCGTTKQGVS